MVFIEGVRKRGRRRCPKVTIVLRLMESETFRLEFDKRIGKVKVSRILGIWKKLCVRNVTAKHQHQPQVKLKPKLSPFNSRVVFLDLTLHLSLFTQSSVTKTSKAICEAIRKFWNTL